MGQALKTKIKSAKEPWLNFFSLMSSAIAARERRPLVPGTPTDSTTRKQQIREIEKQENIIKLLTGWNVAIKRHEDTTHRDSSAFLLELDTSQSVLRMTPFRKDQILLAQSQYLKREKATENNESIQIVLVSADSVAALRRAYPNYYVDTTVFIEAVRQEIRG